ncbi:MAG: hypothetical protein HOL98_02530 [Gammaproteobacteria bacterium]|nr:hypothetical protein [Gammaproteobacteria bacterium]MBT5202309.1 hypothetical protein [Gammaproteobacteria bacterium]MBT5604121.1 hypothetical protein [Gammaproteobacteria bacterium]MBT6246685.1 hypothetical protein [Gammaproteobacteria bacterium]
MFDSANLTRAKNAIMGAFVADAAALGFHWLYSQTRILKLASEEPEFREPDESDFAGNVGYFAHPGKRVGQLSQYGEQCWVMLKSMLDSDGRYDKGAYQVAFRDHFGYGGKFAGYIDRPTRETLDAIYRGEYEALQRANGVPFSGDARQKSTVLVKILAAAKRFHGERLQQEAIYITSPMQGSEACLGYAREIIQALQAGVEFPGAIDEQLPAVSKLPALIARYAGHPDLLGHVESAIRVTNNTPRAINFGMICTQLLDAIIAGEDIDSAIAAGLAVASDSNHSSLQSALASNGSVPELTREVGMHCDLGAGVPSVLFNLKSTSSFVDAIRANIYAGGDNCGRAIILGAVCGGLYGVGGPSGIPTSWIAKLENQAGISAQIDGLFAST